MNSSFSKGRKNAHKKAKEEGGQVCQTVYDTVENPLSIEEKKKCFERKKKKFITY